MEPEPPTMEPEPEPEPEPMDLDLTLKGWERGTDNAFTWKVAMANTETSTTGIEATLVFDVRGNPRVTVNNAANDAVLCAGLDNLAVMTSGTTVSFSGRLTGDCAAGVFGSFDSRGEANTGGTAGPKTGDDVAFELMLANLPDTTAMAKAKAQEIAISGTVTVSHVGSNGGTANDATDDTVDTSKSYGLSGKAKYDTPEIEPAGN